VVNGKWLMVVIGKDSDKYNKSKMITQKYNLKKSVIKPKK